MTSPASPQPGNQDEPPVCRCGHTIAYSATVWTSASEGTE